MSEPSQAPEQIEVDVVLATGFNDSEINQIACACHNINRAYCKAIGDDVQPQWEDAPEWQRESAIAGVKHHLEAMSRGEDVTPEQSHESWMAHKAAEGWCYGPVKDAEKKQHPCFLPYSELPAEQKAKDAIFRQVILEFI